MDNKFTSFLQQLKEKHSEKLSFAYEKESAIINHYMAQNGLSGVDTRMALENIYKAFLRDPGTMTGK